MNDIRIGNRRKHRRDQSVQWRAVGHHHGAEVDSLAHTHDRYAVLADIARDDDVIAWAGLLGSDAHTLGHHTHTGGVDEKTVGTASSDDLGIAGDDADPGLNSRYAHALRDGAEDLHLQALFEDKAGRQPERLGTTAGKVIDGAVDGEVADIAAGKEQWIDDIRIGSQRDSHHPDVQHRRVTGHPAGGSECGQKEVLDEFLGQDAATAVAHHDAFGLTQRQRTHPVSRVDRAGLRHSQTTPAAGIGSRPRRHPRWKP